MRVQLWKEVKKSKETMHERGSMRLPNAKGGPFTRVSVRARARARATVRVRVSGKGILLLLVVGFVCIVNV